MGRKLLNSELGRPSVEEFKQVPRIPVVLVLDNIRSQFNIGAAFRTADAFAAEKLYLCGICATPPSAEIHKSALGAELSMEWKHFDETLDAVQELKAQGYTIVSIEQAEGSVMLDKLQLPINKKYALVFGNEVAGVQQSVVDMSDAVIEIPQCGTKHSINVSVSVGVVLWEFFQRLRGFSKDCADSFCKTTLEAPKGCLATPHRTHRKAKS
jgi:tRNA G18 (ribose-2'-O)-methylase SpoU